MTPASAVGAVDWTALSRELTPADYHRVAREIESAADVPELASLRVAVLSSHSLQFIRPFLIVEGARSGYLIAPYFGPFGQFEQELSPDDSDLYRFEPDALVLALRPEDVDPNALVRFHASGGERFQTLVGELVDRLVHCVERFRERCDGPVLIANCAAPDHVPFGIFEGNVEPSQRSVDVLLGALGRLAACQGTMNNLTFGDASFGYYETIGGGAGAGEGFAGASGVHTHMTNTRITDPEVLETRFPVRLVEFSLRDGSGGAGRWPGGCGLVREIEFLAPMRVSILSERRERAPFGLSGGQPGARGRNLHNGRSVRGKDTFEVVRGDRVRIETPGGGGFGALA